MNIKKIIIVAFFSLSIAGCAVNKAPILTPHQTFSGQQYSADKVKAAILAGGIDKGWSMTPKSQGTIEGTLKTPKQYVVIEVQYDKDSYTINYVNSSGLKAGNGVIHKRYNHWVNLLDKSIRKRLLGV